MGSRGSDSADSETRRLRARPAPCGDGRLISAADLSSELRPSRPASRQWAFCHISGRGYSQVQPIARWPYPAFVTLEPDRTSWITVEDVQRLYPDDGATTVATMQIRRWSPGGAVARHYRNSDPDITRVFDTLMFDASTAGRSWHFCPSTCRRSSRAEHGRIGCCACHHWAEAGPADRRGSGSSSTSPTRSPGLPRRPPRASLPIDAIRRLHYLKSVSHQKNSSLGVRRSSGAPSSVQGLGERARGRASTREPGSGPSVAVVIGARRRRRPVVADARNPLRHRHTSRFSSRRSACVPRESEALRPPTVDWWIELVARPFTANSRAA